MKLELTVTYKTNWGEELILCMGKKRYPLSWTYGDIWKCEIARFNPKNKVEYFYEVVYEGRTVRKEWGKHILSIPSGVTAKTLTVNDKWIDRNDDAPFYSSAFTKGIFRRNGKPIAKHVKKANVVLQVSVPVIRPDEALALAGTGKELGDWNKVIPFDDSDFPVWKLALDVTEPFFYKFLIVNKKTLQPVVWEEGQNRFFRDIPFKDEAVVEASHDTRFYGRRWKGAGTAIPVFSLRSEEDFGVGEFYDLKKMVDWAAATGQSVLQLLPINDTTMRHTWEDSYPYNPNSTFALHPQFLNLKAAGVKQDAEFKSLQAELNALEQFDYERVNTEKRRLLRKAFEKNFDKLAQTDDYKNFYAANEHWLLPYAAFCTLRDEYGTPDFTQWGKMAKYNAKKVAEYRKANEKEVNFNCFIQYHLDKQLSEVCKYAHSKGVIFKGDLPIGISRTSVDAWVYPKLFHMDSQAGAPPDAFAEDGQNWGFPTYNWEKMSEDDYAWWKARLAKMSEYFDAFRIDHILGFFRIWQIPLWSKSGLDGYFNPALPYPANEICNDNLNPEDTGLFIEDPHQNGYYHPRIGARKSESYKYLDQNSRWTFDQLYDDFFYYRHNQFWKATAMKKLPALLESTGMLACGEDLGMIPATVPDVMNELRILSLEIQRMPKSAHDTFANPACYPYLSVCTTSTHDMNPIRAWWEEDREMTDRFFHEVLGEQGQAPFSCEPWICHTILKHHLASPAMLTILPLQDWLSIDGKLRFEDPGKERINVPANSRHYWRYRMHLTIEQLASEDEFNTELTKMISDSGRCYLSSAW